MHYKKQISNAAKESGLRQELIAAVIHAESGFNPQAVSKKGAVGLMQLMPSTAKWCAQQTGKEYSLQMLYEPEYNVSLGAYYLAYLLDKFGSERAALAAYNAGEGNVRRWKEEGLKEIPFRETKKYVQKVTYSTAIYERILN